MNVSANAPLMAGFTRKPPWIVVFSLLYLLNPIGNFLMVVFASGRPPGQILAYLYFSALVRPDPFVLGTLLLWLSAVFLSVGLYRVRLWAWYGFLFHSILTVLSSIYQVSVGQFGPTRAFWINALVLIPLGYFIRREIRKPYFNPSLRWWEQHPRVRESIGVRLAWNEYVFDESTFDLSPDGIFVKTSQLQDVAVGYFFNIRLRFGDERTMDVQGIVVWINFVAGGVPQGFGIKFLGIARRNRDFIGRYIRARMTDGPVVPRRGEA